MTLSEITPRETFRIFHLDLAASEERIVQSHGCLDRVLVRELHVSESLGMAVIFVAENRHPENTVDMSNVVRSGDVVSVTC